MFDSNNNDDEEPVFNIDRERYLWLPQEMLEGITRFYCTNEAVLLYLSSIPRIGNMATRQLWIHHAEITANNIDEARRYAPQIRYLLLSDETVYPELASMTFESLRILILRNLNRFPPIRGLHEPLLALQMFHCDGIRFDDPEIAGTQYLMNRIFTDELGIIRVNFRRDLSDGEIRFLETQCPNARRSNIFDDE